MGGGRVDTWFSELTQNWTARRKFVSPFRTPHAVFLQKFSEQRNAESRAGGLPRRFHRSSQLAEGRHELLGSVLNA